MEIVKVVEAAIASINNSNSNDILDGDSDNDSNGSCHGIGNSSRNINRNSNGRRITSINIYQELRRQ